MKKQFYALSVFALLAANAYCADSTGCDAGSSPLTTSPALAGSDASSDCVKVFNVMAPARVKPGETFEVVSTVSNIGENPVSELTAICRVKGKDTEMTFNIDPISRGQTVEIKFPDMSSDVDGEAIPVSVTVTKVNGNDNTAEEVNIGSTSIISLTEGYPRNVLIEEFTGSWCGWCVRGIVAMDEMKEKHGDGSFIGVAVHYDDMMQAINADYIMRILSKEGAPSMYVEREYTSVVSPDLMSAAYDDIRKETGVGKISLTGSLEEDGILVESLSEFAIDDSYNNYRVGYIVVEDNVGPYDQKNYYSGGSKGVMGGFENEPPVLPMIYNEVVRTYQGCEGIEDSLPGEVAKGTKYPHNYVLPYTRVENKENVWVVAMLINASNRKIVNAVKCTPEPLAGIAEIGTDEDCAPAEYFNLQGLRIMNPERGSIVIKRVGNAVSKVVF